MGEDIYKQHYLIKGQYPKSIKNLSNSTAKKQIIQWRNGQKTWIDTSPKKDIQMADRHMKKCSHYSSSGKYKSKPQWDTTSHLSEWLTSTTQTTTDVGEDAEKDLFCTAGGNANWCSHSANSTEVPQKIRNRATLWPRNCTTKYLPKGYRYAVSKGHMHPNVYRRAIDNSQCMERAQRSIDGWMDKEVVYICNRVLLSDKT